MASSTVRSITAHLLSISTQPTYLSATKNHPFLISAADGTLSDEQLSFWLCQDHIYAAYAYPRFIGSLISHIPFNQPHPCAEHSQAILEILVGALENIVREVKFFKSTAKTWGLDYEKWGERRETRDYTAEMARISGTGRIEEGLLFLWAMEKVSVELCITQLDPHQMRNFELGISRRMVQHHGCQVA
jgi:thiaminase